MFWPSLTHMGVERGADGADCPAISSRFTCVLDGAGVRDNETGLV
jgi:hypothetical protein